MEQYRGRTYFSAMSVGATIGLAPNVELSLLVMARRNRGIVKLPATDLPL